MTFSHFHQQLLSLIIIFSCKWHLAPTLTWFTFQLCSMAETSKLECFNRLVCSWIKLWVRNNESLHNVILMHVSRWPLGNVIVWSSTKLHIRHQIHYGILCKKIPLLPIRPVWLTARHLRFTVTPPKIEKSYQTKAEIKKRVGGEG